MMSKEAVIKLMQILFCTVYKWEVMTSDAELMYIVHKCHYLMQMPKTGIVDVNLNMNIAVDVN